jgi:hypothetical protein
MTQDEVQAFADFAQMLLFGGMAPRPEGPVHSPTPEPLLGSSPGEGELVHFTMALDSNTLKFFTNGESETEVEVEFSYTPGDDVFYLNGEELELALIEGIEEDMSINSIINKMLSDEDIKDLFYFETARQSLAAKYDFENIQGNSVNDSVNGFDGKLKGGAKTHKGTENSSLRLERAGEHMIVENNEALSFSDEMTFSAWLNYEPGKGYLQQIIHKGYSDDNYDLLLYNGELLFIFTDSVRGQTRAIFTREVNLVPGTWYHLGMTASPEGLNFYVNGELVYNSGIAINLSSSNDDIFIGKRNYRYSYYNYYGLMDEICLFNRALTDDEMRSVYRSSFIR